MTEAGSTPTASPALEFSYLWNVREHAHARNVTMTNRLRSEGLAMLLAVAVALLLVADGFAVYLMLRGRPGFLQLALPFTLAVFVGLWVLLFGRGWISALHQRQTDSTIQHPIHLIFGVHGLRVRGKSAEISLRWKSMKRVTETAEFVLFYYTHGRAYYLPKRVADAERLTALRALIRANVPTADLRA